MGSKVKIDNYFLNERCPFSNRRTPNWKRIKFVSFIGLGVLVMGLLIAVPNPDKAAAVASANPSQTASPPPTVSPSGTQYLQRQDIPDTYTLRGGGGRSSRQYNASQVVRRGDGSSGDRLPMGSTILAKLVNSVLSTDSHSPVIAEITDDILWKNTVMIPAGTRAIGQASMDDSTQRLQARFTTLVFPEGDQHPISAMALMGDGSSGIAGNYHSRTLEKQGGRFFGNFVGGLAEGMKEKKTAAGSQSGIVFEPGSLKNGLLNGLAASSFDQAKVFSESAQNVRPYLDVDGGTPFLLYLEKEFGP